MTTVNPDPNETEECVRERYSAASKEREAALCCPVVYDTKLLEVVPQEVIDRDYGCGDPSPYVKPGDTVVDLGSGGGKLCFIISQLVGKEGKVIGVDCNQDMLDLARKSQPVVAERIGFDNIDFRCGQIQDLALDLDLFAQQAKEIDAATPGGAVELVTLQNQLRSQMTMIPDNSVDCVVSNCVLNLVNPSDRDQLFREINRVLRPGGLAAISDIVSDEDIPESMQKDAELWSGCISGAWREDLFAQRFLDAGFYGMTIDKRQAEPWQVIGGIEFRSVTLLAFKNHSEPCYDRMQAVIYKGPFSQVDDDEGHTYFRGQRMAICDRTFRMLQESPYRDQFEFLKPANEIPMSEAQLMSDCSNWNIREPGETKGSTFQLPTVDGDCCGGNSCC